MNCQKETIKGKCGEGYTCIDCKKEFLKKKTELLEKLTAMSPTDKDYKKVKEEVYSMTEEFLEMMK